MALRLFPLTDYNYGTNQWAPRTQMTRGKITITLPETPEMNMATVLAGAGAGVGRSAEHHFRAR